MMINRNFLISQLFGVLGMICLGLGIASFTGAGEGIHPLLEGRAAALALVGGGGILVIIELRMLIPVLLKRAREAGRT